MKLRHGNLANAKKKVEKKTEDRRCLCGEANFTQTHLLFECAETSEWRATVEKYAAPITVVKRLRECWSTDGLTHKE